MRSFFVSIIMAISTSVSASETITIRSPYDHNHAGNPALQAIISAANRGQDQYNFIMSSHPGGQGTVAVGKVDPQKDLALIHPSFVQNYMAGSIKQKDWVPVGALGDACFLLISQQGNAGEGIRSLKKSSGPYMIGVVGLGSATHLLALEITSSVGVPIEPVLFKSAGEAVLTLISQNELTMTVGNINQFRTVVSKKNTATSLGAFCPTRHPDMPEVKTFNEQGIKTPLVFNILMAHTDMPKLKKEQLAKIWDRAVKEVGKDKIFALSGFVSPHFDNMSMDEYTRQRIMVMQSALEKHKNQITSK